MIVCHEPGCNQMKKKQNKKQSIIFAAEIGIQSFITTPLSSVSRSPVYAYSLVILCSFWGKNAGNQFSVVGTSIEFVSQKACAF